MGLVISVLVQAKMEVGPGFQGQGVGAGMSGVRLVGALGRDQAYVSAWNPTHTRKAVVGVEVVGRGLCLVRG